MSLSRLDYVLGMDGETGCVVFLSGVARPLVGQVVAELRAYSLHSPPGCVLFDVAVTVSAGSH